MSKINPKFRKNLCVAGGAILDEFLNIYIPQGYPKIPNDIDAYLVGLADDELELFVAELLNSFACIFMCTRTVHSLNIRFTHISPIDPDEKAVFPLEFKEIMGKYGDSDPPKLQIILRSYASPSEVVTGFDLDASGVCFYGGKYYATPRAMYAMERMILTFDLDRLSTTYNFRMLKYMIEKGFATYIPVPIATELFSEIPRLLPIMYKNPTSDYQNTLIGFLAMEVTSSIRKLRIWERSDYDETTKKIPSSSSSSSVSSLGSSFASSSFASDPLDAIPESADPEDDSPEDEGPPNELDLMSYDDFCQLSKEEQYTLSKMGEDEDDSNEDDSDSELADSHSTACERIFGDHSFGFSEYYQNYYARSIKNHVRKYIYRGSSFDVKMMGYTILMAHDKERLGHIFNFPPLDKLPADVCEVPSHIEFVTTNPGSQFTGSFNPVTLSWLEWGSIPI